MRIFQNLAAFAIVGMLLVSCQSNEPALVDNQPNLTTTHLIPLEKALENADNMFTIIGEGQTRSARKIKNVSRFMKGTRAENGDNLHGFYVVNYENDGGFALLSADDRHSDAVYAISEEGQLNLTDTIDNKGLSWYLNYALPQISTMGVFPPRDTVPMIDMSEKLYKQHSNPLLGTYLSYFHQRSPYNNYCGIDPKTNLPNLAGCGPVAIGTAMGYKEWPKSFGGYTFNWGAMKINRTHDLWARLFALIGQEAGVTYGSSSTTTPFEGIIYAFKSFGYKYAKELKYFDADLANNNLENNELFLLYGWQPAVAGSAHLWVVDGGYTTEQKTPGTMGFTTVYRDYYHCVWGWSGTSNGYYLYTTTGIGGDAAAADDGKPASTTFYEYLRIYHDFRTE